MRCRKTRGSPAGGVARRLPSPFPYSFSPTAQRQNNRAIQPLRGNCPAPAEPPELLSTEPALGKFAPETFSDRRLRPPLAASIFRWLDAVRVRNALRPIR